VTALTRTRVIAIDADGVTLHQDGTSKRIQTRTVLWAAGVQASPLGGVLARRTGATLDRAGRVVVEPDCSLPGYPDIFVIGDLACFTHQTGTPLAALAPVAMQQGQYVARRLQRRLRGGTGAPFHYFDYGTMAVIGRGAAVAQIRRLHFNGYVAWLAWVFIHIMRLVEYDHRVLVFVQWAMNYFTWKRGARLMTGEGSLPLGRKR
jgi:NADH dehydrogenase